MEKQYTEVTRVTKVGAIGRFIYALYPYKLTEPAFYFREDYEKEEYLW